MLIVGVSSLGTEGSSLPALLRAEHPRIPITVVTGHGGDAIVLNALRAGVTDFLRKPVRDDDLSAALVRMHAALDLARRFEQKLPLSARFVEMSWTFEIDNDVDAVPAFVEYFVQACASGAGVREATDLSLALRELLLNAIEHGNLGLSYDEKAQALQAGSLNDLLAGRLAQPDRASLHTRITARRRDDLLEVAIQDQGNGFDWRELPDPTHPANVLAEHGRGVLLASVSVSKLEYRGNGSAVSFSKRLRPYESSSGPCG